MKIPLLVTFIAALLPFTAQAGFEGSVEFTAEEKAAHARHCDRIVKVARRYLENVWTEHQAFYRRHGVSKYYGDRNTALDTRNERIAALRQAGAPASLVDQLQPTSCVGLTMIALRTGFQDPRDPALDSAWEKINRFARANALDGSALLDALQKLGWKIYYWNPNPADNARWDREEANWRSKGWHGYRYATVMNRGTYYFNKVDDRQTLVGFGDRPPRAVLDVPFFVGVAHTGYHVFPGFEGTVIEAHSTRRLDSIHNLESNPFNPLGSGGAPRWTPSEKYRSGLIGIPPV